MHRLTQASFLVAVTLLVASCSDSDLPSGFAQPSLVDGSSVVVSTMSSSVAARPVANPLCPSIAPFNVPFVLLVRANGAADIVITGIGLQFTDTSGLQAPQVNVPMPPVTSPAPLPVVNGGMMVAGLSTRSVPLTLGIGCGTGIRGTIVIIVQTSDDTGRTRSSQVSVAVR